MAKSQKIKLINFLITQFYLLMLCALPFAESFAYEKNHKNIQITPLMQAVAANDIEGVKFFTKVNPSDLNKQNIGGASPLHIAVRNNNLAIIKILLNSNLNVDLIDNEGYSPLMRAVSYSNPEIVHLLLQKNPKISQYNKNLQTVIVLSAISSCNSCLNQILDYVIPDQNISLIDLKKQIKEAFIIASWKENQNQKIVLNDFYDKLKKHEQEKYFLLQKMEYENNKRKLERVKNTYKNSKNKQKTVTYKFNNQKYKRSNDVNKLKYVLISGDKKQQYFSDEKNNDEEQIIYVFKKGKTATNQPKKRSYKKNIAKKKKKYKEPIQEIIIEPTKNGQKKTLIFDGKNTIRKDSSDNIEVQDSEIKKTFIVK